MEKVIGDGSSVFEEEKAGDEEKIPPSKTSPAVSSPPETSGEYIRLPTHAWRQPPPTSAQS